MLTRLAFINTCGPFTTAKATESLDMALIFGSFEQSVGLFFTGDGVYQLLKQQHAARLSAKDLTKTFAALPFYDIEDIYVCESALQTRGLTKDDLCIDVTVLCQRDWQQQLSSYQHLVTY